MGKIDIFQEAERCLMCQDAPCGKKVADAIRAIRFENPARAKGLFEGENLEEAQVVTRPLRLRTASLASWATSA